MKDFQISDWILGFLDGFQDFTKDFQISDWILGFLEGFQDFTEDLHLQDENCSRQ